MALADVFDALVSKRCYKEAFSFDKAFEIIKNDSGSHFDKKLTEVFLQCRPELEQFYSSDVQVIKTRGEKYSFRVFAYQPFKIKTYNKPIDT